MDLDTRQACSYLQAHASDWRVLLIGQDSAAGPGEAVLREHGVHLIIDAQEWTDSAQEGAAACLELAMNCAELLVEPGLSGADLACELATPLAAVTITRWHHVSGEQAEAEPQADSAGGSDSAQSPPSPLKRPWRKHPPRPQTVRLNAIPVQRRALMGLPMAESPATPTEPGARLAAAVLAALDGGSVPEEFSALPAGAARLSTRGCCGDGLCVRSCPHEALALEQSGEPETDLDLRRGVHLGGAARAPRPFSLRLRLDLCTDCGACLQVCPSNALSRLGEATWAQVLQTPQVKIGGGVSLACRRCGAPHSGSSGLCTVCEQRSANPYAVHWPPGR
ncbi:ATP-binding protein [Gephyromycinifex aptenodytis]|uniref:ATP-binding protein n=1 Tax=Gephyromycinifex aptenodytis TaxID=2716227 RepID=UPI0014489253|nr:4Fe-4S dicluster domain-containing protein [Gephyromycinifex aptenodytis]